MSVFVNKDKCIGCAACTQICSNSFVMSADGKAEAVDNNECTLNAVEACPTKAIIVE